MREIFLKGRFTTFITMVTMGFFFHAYFSARSMMLALGSPFLRVP